MMPRAERHSDFKARQECPTRIESQLTEWALIQVV